MPRYHFPLSDGDAETPDPVGTDLPDIEAARLAAVRTLLEIARYRVDGAADSTRLSMKVVEQGRVLLVVEFALNVQAGW